MFTESSSPNLPNKVFFMNSPDFSETQEPFMLTFQYHMYGAAIGDLELFSFPASASPKQLLWKRSGNGGKEWHNASIIIQPGVTGIQFYATTTNSFTGDIAIDNVLATGITRTYESETMQTCLDYGKVACPLFSPGLLGHVENCHEWLPQCQP